MKNCSSLFCGVLRPKTSAFSLVEMLMALLVASLLLAALAPVITKKVETLDVKNELKATQNTMRAFINPGNYAFEVPSGVKEIEIQGAGGGGGGGGASYKTYKETFNGNKDFIVPKGVYEISFTLVGGGGAGGSANANIGTDACESGTKQLFGMSDSGKDLCVTHTGPTSAGMYYIYKTVEAGEVCEATSCCWINIPDSCTEAGCDEIPKTACTYHAAAGWCASELPFSTHGTPNNGRGRLLTKTELERILENANASNLWYGTNGLNQCSPNSGVRNKYGIPYCKMAGLKCPGTGNNYCYTYAIWLKDADWYDSRLGGIVGVTDGSYGTAGSVICARDLHNWYPYTGAGGSSASKYTQKIKVTPGDRIRIVIGAGGSGAKAGIKGNDGKPTYLYHTNSKTNIETTYFAGGGIGGNPAATNAHGKETKPTLSCSTGGNCTVAIKENEGKGTAGTELQGGTGAGGATGGEFIFYTNTTKSGAANTGGGGGGGACLKTLSTTKSVNSCQSGGSGGSGYAEIEYSIASPGGGGGAGGTIGYDRETSIEKSLRLNVSSNEVINITVGAGGSGGGINSSGNNGKDTVISRRKGSPYTFKGGNGGKTGTFSATNTQIPGEGGIGGNYPDTKTSTYTEIVAPLSTKGLDGGSDDKGFAGGEGAKNVNNYEGGCGGMQVNTETEGACNSSTENGEDAIEYNAATNRYGGTGGGGGGLNPDTGAKGTGGSGAGGYVLIKWKQPAEEEK